MIPSNDRSTQIQAVQAKYADQLLSKPHVVGISVGRADHNPEELVLVVLVNKNVPNHMRAEEDRIPDILDGVRVVTRKVGAMTALMTAIRKRR